jgi:hypothetical protein
MGCHVGGTEIDWNGTPRWKRATMARVIPLRGCEQLIRIKSWHLGPVVQIEDHSACITPADC